MEQGKSWTRRGGACFDSTIEWDSGCIATVTRRKAAVSLHRTLIGLVSRSTLSPSAPLRTRTLSRWSVRRSAARSASLCSLNASLSGSVRTQKCLDCVNFERLRPRQRSVCPTGTTGEPIKPLHMCVCGPVSPICERTLADSSFLLLLCLSSSSRYRRSHAGSVPTLETDCLRVTNTATSSTRRGLRRRRRTRVTTIVPTAPRRRTAHLCPVNRKSTLSSNTRRHHRRGTGHTRSEPINP